MLSSLFTGVSGLKANGMAMAVIGDNISNVNTIAFKANSATFANVLRRSLAGATGNEIGNGVHLWGLSPLWAQGSLETTSNSTDMAIDGRGFFMVKHDNGDIFYTRAGVFSFDSEGNLVNPNGLVVQGYKYEDGELGADLTDISIPSGNIPPNATKNMSMNINLDSRAEPATSGIETATGTLECSAENSGILLTANEAGEAGNGITIEYTDSGAGGLSVSVTDNTITVDLGGDTPTANDVVSLINGDADASALVTAALVEGQDGSGTVESGVSVALSGGVGSGPVQASVTVDCSADNADVLYTANEAGEAGNEISIEYIDSGAGGLSVSVDGNTITVDLGGDTPTANDVVSLINGDADASALVTAATAEGQDGSGTVEVAAAVNLAGGVEGSEGTPADTYATTMTVYDSLGSPLTLTVTFTCLGENQWQWEAESSEGECTSSGTIAFNDEGQLVSPAEDPTIDITGLQNGAQDLSIAWELTDNENFTGYSLRSMTTFQNQDGYASGTVQSVSVDRNGIISGVYSNGQMWPIYQIALADFPSYAGLDAVGENLYGESFTSGQPTIGIAGSGTIGNISPSSLEMSNVDLANEFVKMITTQRAYQANARVITTSDEILSELMNVKR